MNEILAEKLEVVIDQFEQFNGGKINAVGSKMEELETSMASLQKSLAEIKIPEEVMLRIVFKKFRTIYPNNRII